MKWIGEIFMRFQGVVNLVFISLRCEATSETYIENEMAIEDCVPAKFYILTNMLVWWCNVIKMCGKWGYIVGFFACLFVCLFLFLFFNFYVAQKDPGIPEASIFAPKLFIEMFL